MKGRIRRAVYWMPAAVWMGVIFYFSSLSEPIKGPSDTQVNLMGNIAHFVEYAGLAFWITFGQMKGKIKISKVTNRIVFISILGSMLFAFTDEFHQLFVPGRNFLLKDLGIDAFGAGFFGVCVFLLRWRRR